MSWVSLGSGVYLVVFSSMVFYCILEGTLPFFWMTFFSSSFLLSSSSFFLLMKLYSASEMYLMTLMLSSQAVSVSCRMCLVSTWMPWLNCTCLSDRKVREMLLVCPAWRWPVLGLMDSSSACCRFQLNRTVPEELFLR